MSITAGEIDEKRKKQGAGKKKAERGARDGMGREPAIITANKS